MIYYADPRTFDCALLQQALPLLPEEKQTSVKRIVNLPARRQAIAAWALLIYALRAQNREPPPLSFTETGKPYFKGSELHFNLSHTETLVCAALCDRPIGIDAQTLTAPSDGVIRRVTTAEEQDLLRRSNDPTALFTRFWTQKEAYAKWTGEGLSCGFSSLNFAPYAQRDAFEAYETGFRVWTFSDTVMSVCAEAPPEQTQPVSPQMLKTLLFATRTVDESNDILYN